MEDIRLRPIGVIHSDIGPEAIGTRHWGPARIEVFPPYRPGLLRIGDNSHIMIIAWLHRAGRDVLQVHRPLYPASIGEKGVFACRCPARPNPIGTTTARLLRVDEGNLYVDCLDMIDGTPVLDIKPHAAGFDGVFAARCARDLLRPPDPDPERACRDMMQEAANFHGERCRGLALGVRMMYEAMWAFRIAQKDPALTVAVGDDGCVADALQALSGATFGNRRLGVQSGPAFRLSCRGETLVFTPRPLAVTALDEIWRRESEALFDVERM